MYTEGLQIGDNSYLLKENDNFVLVTSKGTTEQMKEYIKLKNEYEQKEEKYSEVHRGLQLLKEYDKKEKCLKLKFFIASFLIEGGFIVVGAGLSALSYPFAIEWLIAIGVMLFGISMITPPLIYGTKKTRKKTITKASEYLEREAKEIEKIVEKLQTLNKKIESQIIIDKKEESILPITTVENKKANVKMRVLKLNQSR